MSFISDGSLTPTYCSQRIESMNVKYTLLVSTRQYLRMKFKFWAGNMENKKSNAI